MKIITSNSSTATATTTNATASVHTKTIATNAAITTAANCATILLVLLKHFSPDQIFLE